MELQNSIDKAPLISIYAARFKSWVAIKLTHRLLCRAIFYLGWHNRHVSITEPSSPTDWGEFSEPWFSADVTMERDCETV